jgi:hypothetical protein
MLVALVFKNPVLAARLKNRFMRNPTSYSSVFSEELPLNIWPVIVEVVKGVERGLISARLESGELGDRFVAKWRSLVSLICVARIIGTFDYSQSDLIKMDLGAVTTGLVSEVWAPIEQAAQVVKRRAFRNPEFVLEQCKAAALAHRLAGIAYVGRQLLPIETASLDETFLRAVNELLPKVPAGVVGERVLAAQLNCRRSRVKSAIFILRRRGMSIGSTTLKSGSPPH